MNSPPTEPSQGAPPPPHPHAPNYSGIPNPSPTSHQPQFAPPSHGASHPHYPAQYYHGSYFDSFSRPRRWWWGSSSLHQLPPPPPAMPPPGAAPPLLPPHPHSSLPCEPHHHQQRMYRTCYRRGRGPRLFPVLAFGAIVFFATKHHYTRRREEDRERYLPSSSSSSSSAGPWAQQWERRAPGPWHWHDRERARAAEPAKTAPGAPAVGEEAPQTHDEMWAEQWAKAMGRVPPTEKQQRGAGAEGEKWV